MYATSERRSDGKPSSRGALVDVEVDRCIDENSASNLKHRLSLNKASSTKTEDPSINQISDSSQIASRNPNFFLTVTREAPTTDIYEGIYNRMKDISICILIRFNNIIYILTIEFRTKVNFLLEKLSSLGLSCFLVAKKLSMAI